MLAEFLAQTDRVVVRQVVEKVELLGVEGRNRYEILTPQGELLARAEEERGWLGFFLRQVMSHWRTFHVDIEEPDGRKVVQLVHPFRLLFQELQVLDAQGNRLGKMVKNWTLLSKKFTLTGSGGSPMEMNSGFFSVWKFPFYRQGRQVACLHKEFGGFLKELFTDADTFVLDFEDRSLSLQDRLLLLGAALFVDLEYFEVDANRSRRRRRD